MEHTATLKELINLINIESGCSYILFAVALSLLIRLILCFFKAKAIVKGESDTDGCKDNKLKGKDIKAIISQSFWSNSGDVRIDDHWLPVLIGIIELIFFPFFMAQGFWKAIIGWIGVKALSSWGGKNTRTAYNRFLIGNILTLIAAIIISILYIN